MTIRPATRTDAALIARHRGLMFIDMGAASPEESEQITAAAGPWFRPQIEAETYLAWIVEEEGVIAASGGIHLRELGPVPAV